MLFDEIITLFSTQLEDHVIKQQQRYLIPTAEAVNALWILQFQSCGFLPFLPLDENLPSSTSLVDLSHLLHARLRRVKSVAHILKCAAYFAYVGANIINAARKCGALLNKTGALVKTMSAIVYYDDMRESPEVIDPPQIEDAMDKEHVHDPAQNATKPNQLATSSVRDLLECPVCLNAMYPPIHQCSNGHTLCSGCKPRVHNRCPTCRHELGNIRCLALEKVAASLELP
nr:E3 ubiquitin-protein ligase DIS1-like isoform X2 [Tanacetum cinerariifolium]